LVNTVQICCDEKENFGREPRHGRRMDNRAEYIKRDGKHSSL
jgi:hypothetical protein